MLTHTKMKPHDVGYNDFSQSKHSALHWAILPFSMQQSGAAGRGEGTKLHKMSLGGNTKDCCKSEKYFDEKKIFISAKRETCVNYVIQIV